MELMSKFLNRPSSTLRLYQRWESESAHSAHIHSGHLHTLQSVFTILMSLVRRPHITIQGSNSSISQHLRPHPLDPTGLLCIGASFIGMVAAAVLYGISCVQALHYYTKQNDPWYLKYTVTVVLIFGTLHQALITHTVYIYTVTDWGATRQLLRLDRWSVVIELIFTGVTAFIVQSFLTMRIWRLSGRNIYITATSGALVTGGLVTLIIFVVKAVQIKHASDLPKIKGVSISINALNTAADILIAATLCTLLNGSRTGYHKSEVIINRLILFTVNTGLPTSFCALASLISIIVSPNTFIFTSFSSCLGRLYTITLLATLNHRFTVRRNLAESADAPVSLRNLSQSGSNQHQNISIKISTATQKYHDQKIDEEKVLPSDEESASRQVSY